MSKSITDFLKPSSSSRTQGSSSISKEQNELSNIQQHRLGESDNSSSGQSSSTIDSNVNIPVQYQPGADYPFPMTKFGKKNRSCQAS